MQFVIELKDRSILTKYENIIYHAWFKIRNNWLLSHRGHPLIPGPPLCSSRCHFALKLDSDNPKHLNYLALSLPDEGYSRNAS